MKRALPLAAALLLGTLASNAAESDLVSWTAFGIGTDSCVNWQSTDAHKTEGNAWILGFWSALNLASRIDAKIDADVDANSIWSEVAAACATTPSGKLADAVLVTYDKMIVKRPGVMGNWTGVRR
ncbi:MULTISPECIES: hypothetical protein [unclassified Beijerinckia]|uniref:hypothetical protein n=1 Tax=unclassified Beijerinckia TaxID=2638183 RepID=UPI000894E5B9|nr:MULTISPECIES: hypothetical protein [unclassified Beijerinckia]MDH7795317.1 hypothetical protein [Beijerinckia sp. GAS462]SEB96546.1 hypothetical protein SAMN05443249_1590 [Beijerinckia sp. 28-YEA-48]